MFTRVGRSPFVFVSFIRCTTYSMAWWLYPRLRVLYLHPANRYEAVRESVVGGALYHCLRHLPSRSSTSCIWLGRHR
jgi:hypothetical protein